MSYTEATLLTRVKKRTKRDELSVIGDNSNADFTFYTKESARKLSQDSLSLRGSASGSLSADSNTISIPSDMIDGTGSIDGITLGSTTNSRNDPSLDPISWEEYLQGAKEGYVLRNKVIYVRPFPDTDRTYNLYYRKFHGSSVTTLEFDDKYQESHITLICKMVYEDLGPGWSARADEQELKYKRELNDVVDADQPPIVASRQRS
jgi:hypothetical protein